MAAVFLKGFLLSIALVASIGMQNLFVFNTALNNRFGRANLIATFVWLADSTLTIVAFFGVGALLTAFPLVKILVMLIGGAIVVWLGIGIIRSATAAQLGQSDTVQPLGAAFRSAWLVTWANPQALLDVSLMYGALRGSMPVADYAPFIIGVVIATAVWFYGMTTLLNLLRDKLPAKVMVVINMLSGLIVTGYGVLLIWRGLQAAFGF